MRRAQRDTTPISPRPSAGPVRRRVTLGCAGLLTLAVAAAGCGGHNRSSVGNTPVNGRMATYALPANVTPNYIFPFSPGVDFTIVNLDNLQYLLYRPLYWFGDNGLPYLNEKLSLAYQPQYNGQVVTIKIKPNLRWSNGEPITARDVVFWMNMMKAVGHTEWGGYIQGDLPDNVTNIHAVSQSVMKMTIIGKYSPQWFTNNQLSQITPMPKFWDRSGPNAPKDCTDRVSDCAAVFNYLNEEGAKTATWVTSPLWKVVDGPWQLTGYSQGVLTYSFNNKYSLPLPSADHISKFREIPFTTEQAEYNQLQAGGSNPIDVGYLPTVDAPVALPGKPVGQNPVPGYNLQPVYVWGLSYMPINFNPADPQVAIFNQTYIRQALQLLVNQAEIIQGPLHGYGVTSTGPVGDSPRTPYLSRQARRGNLFSYSPPEARKLLADHGWDVRRGSVTTCTSPGIGLGHCGKGVRAGATLSFKMMYATGNAWVESAVLQLQSNASLVGIDITLTPGTFDNIVGTAIGDCGPHGNAPCKWQLADWGEGWSYVPDYLPTGDELFGTGSIGNIGQYSNPHNDHLIKATIQASAKGAFLQAMYKWQDWLTPQVPVLIQPTAPAALFESIDNLKIGKQSPTLALTPEDWYYVR
jgi:peptide/nickel transport system substrate-binding protein